MGAMEHSQGDDVLPSWSNQVLGPPGRHFSVGEVAWAGFRAQGHSILRLCPQLSVGCQVHPALE